MTQKRSPFKPDSTIQNLVGQAREKQEAEKTDGRGRAGHGKKKGVDKQGKAKKTFIIPLPLQALIEEMAEEEEVSQADIVCAATRLFYNLWSNSQIDLHEHKEIHGKSLRVVFKLELPQDFNPFLDDAQQQSCTKAVPKAAPMLHQSCT